MLIHMTAPLPCPNCGHDGKAFQQVPVRVNKRSLRSTGVALLFADRMCKGCKAFLPDPVEWPQRWRLTEESRAEVAAVRARRWPS